MNARAWKTAAQALLVAVAYFITGWLGLMRPALGSHITLIWLPTGISVAVLLRYGAGCWPGITLGALSVNLAYVAGLPASLAIAVGNTLGPLLAVWTLRRIGFRQAFDRQRDILLLGLAAVLGMLVSASGGVTALWLAGELPGDRFTAWLAWWAGDTMGVILGAPLVLAFSRAEVRTILLRRAEFAVWLCVTGVVTWCVFAQNRGAGGEPWSLAFISLPFVAWAALRYGPAGTSVAVMVLSVGAAYGTVTGRGPLFRAHPIEGSAVLWLFMASSALLGWLVTAMQSARVQATGIQRLLEQALSDVSLGVLLAGLDRRITYANQGFTRLTGYGEAELIGKSCAILQGPDTDRAMAEKISASLRGDGFFDGEILNCRKDGTTFWNALLVSPVHDGRGVKTGFLGIQRDVSKRKQAEIALQQSEERLRQIIEIVPECVKLLSPDGKVIEMNPAGLALVGARSADEIRGRAMVDFIVPEDRERFFVMHRRVLNGESVRGEFSMRGLGGAHRWVETHAVPYRDARREIIGVLSITRDITERRSADAMLRASEDLFRRLIDCAPEAVALLDAASGLFVQVNPEAERIFKLPAAELCRSGPIPLSPPTQPDGRPSAEKATEFLSRAIAGETPVFEWIHRDAEGRDFPCEVRLLRLDVGGRTVVRGSITDITERKRAEAAVRESEGRYRRIVETTEEGVMTIDPQEKITFVNPKMARMLGFASEEMIGKGLFDFMDEEARAEAAEHVKRRKQGVTGQFDFSFRRKDGSEVWTLISANPIFDENGAYAGSLAMVTDVTGRKRAEIEREQLERKIQETQKLESLGVLAGGIAHDFNNLLTSVLGNASMAAMDVPPGSPVQICIEQITEAALRAADLCKQMLAYSGRGRFVVQTLDLGQLVEQTTQMLQISISKKAVLRFRLEKNLPPVEVDATQIRQVIMNLVINASEAIGDRSGVISLSTGLTRVDRSYLAGTLMDPDLPEGEYVFLEVSDTGCGMSPDTQAKIFDPFFTTKFTGRGLGLAAVIGIVRGHKGAMKVYSEVGRGTTFKLLFPAARDATEASPAVPAAAHAWQGKGTVLVADDEETMRSTVARMLRVFGIEPVLASDGREAVQIFRDDPSRFSIVLLDLTMPHMDGEQAFAELRRVRPDVRVVLMSGFNAQEAMVRFTGKGLASFLQKPFTLGELRTVLQEVLG